MFNLDAVVPLVFILEETQKGTLTSQSAAEAAKAALLLLGNASAQTAKERRKKVTKDLNKDLMSLAEDPEKFEDAAPLLFGASFERKMKEHLESLKCLRQSMAPKMGTEVTSFFEGAAPSIRLGVAAATTEQEADRDFSPTPIKEAEKRRRDHSRGGDNWRNRNKLCRDSLCLENITCDAYFARIKRILPFCDS